MVNDVTALRADGAIETVAALDVPVCLMHMKGQPRDMQEQPEYEDVVGEVEAFLAERAEACTTAGIAADRVVIDPGFGFGKTLEHNIELFRSLPELCRLGYPVLVGISRKSMLGAITGRPVEQRLAPSVAAAVLAALVLRFRSQWGVLAAVVGWSAWISAVALSAPDATRQQAIAEGCIGSPVLFIIVVAAICGAMILYTSRRTERPN